MSEIIDNMRLHVLGKQLARSVSKVAADTQATPTVREYARITAVNGDGTLELDKGTEKYPMPISSVRRTVGAEAKVGDVVVVETINHVPLVTSIVSTDAKTDGRITDAINSAVDAADEAVTKASDAAETATSAAKDASEASSKASDAAQAAEDAASKAGEAVTSVTVEYAVGTSDTTAPTSGWGTAQPTRDAGTYIWQRTVTATAEGKSETSAPALITGNQGERGEQGERGADADIAGAEKAIANANAAASTATTAATNANSATTAANNAASAASKVNATVSGTTLTVTDRTGKSTSVDTKGAKGDTGATGAGFAWNLAPGTASGEGWEKTSFDASTRTFSREVSGVWGTVEDFILTTNVHYEKATTYTVSCWMWGNEYAKMPEIYSYSGSFGSTIRTSGYLDITTEPQYFTWTFTTDENDPYETCYLRFDNNGSTASGTQAILYVRDVKLEQGTTATAWCTTQAETVGASVSTVKMQYAQSDSSTTAPATGWQDSVPEWVGGKYIWQRSVTTKSDGTTDTSAAVLYGVMNSIASDVEGNTSRLTQAADALGLTFGDGKATGTLITADSTGIEVGYSTDGSSFSSTHTKMGTDAFTIHDADHNELASFGEKIDLLNSSGEMQVGDYSIGSAVTEPQFRLCSPTERPIVMQTPASVTSYRAESSRLELAARGSTYYDQDGTRYTSDANTVELMAGSEDVRAAVELRDSDERSEVTIMASAPLNSASLTLASTTKAAFAEPTLRVGTSTANGYVNVTVPVYALALMLQPRAWKFSRYAIGNDVRETFAMQTWHNIASIMATNQTGLAYSDWLSPMVVAAGGFTVKRAGYWRVTLQVEGECANRIVAGIYVNGGKATSVSANTGGIASAVATHVFYGAMGATCQLRFYSDAEFTLWEDGAYTFAIVEYLGPDPA